MNKFLQSSLARAAQQVAGPSQAQQTSMLGNAGSSIGGGAAPTAPVAPMAPTGGGMDQANPFEGKTFQITPANMKGDAKPVFNESTSNAAAMMYGSPTERQMSMPKAGTSAMPMEGPLERNAFTKAMADTGGDYEAAQEILKNK